MESDGEREDLEEALLPGWTESSKVTGVQKTSYGSITKNLTTPVGNEVDSGYEDDRISSTMTTSDDNAILPEDHKDSIFIRCLRSTTIEPMLFLNLLAFYLTSVLNLNLYIDRVCRLTLNYTEDVCRMYSHGSSGLKDPTIEAEIEVRVSTLMIYENIIEYAPIIIFALFLGSWCDRYGTKKPMIFSVFGSFLSSLILATITYFPSLPPEFIWLAFIPLGFSGGEIARNVTAYSYMARITNEKNRSFRLIVLQMFWFVGMPIGTLIGPKIFERTDFPTVYIISCVIFALALLYGVFFIEADNPESYSDHHKSSVQRSKVISISAVKDMITVIFKKREGLQRRWVILLWILMVCRVLVGTSITNLTYLFTRQQLGWDAQSYTEFTSIKAFTGIPGDLAVAYFALKIFKLRDEVVGFYTSIGYTIASLVYAFATESWMVYLGAAIGLVCGVQFSITRSLLSKAVEPNEIAKAFCFISLTDAFLQIPAGTLFNIFYNFTLASWAGSFYFVHVIIYICMTCVFGYFIRSLGQTTDVNNSSFSA